MGMDECFERGMLRQGRPDALKAEFSIKVSKEKLEEAKKLSAAGFHNVALVIAYAAMFHAGRALLFNDGVMEKSHFCLIAYLREKYVPSGKLLSGIVSMMDSFREERHDVMYGLNGLQVKESDAKEALENAGKLIDEAEKLLQQAKKEAEEKEDDGTKE